MFKRFVTHMMFCLLLLNTIEENKFDALLMEPTNQRNTILILSMTLLKRASNTQVLCDQK